MNQYDTILIVNAIDDLHAICLCGHSARLVADDNLKSLAICDHCQRKMFLNINVSNLVNLPNEVTSQILLGSCCAIQLTEFDAFEFCRSLAESSFRALEECRKTESRYFKSAFLEISQIGVRFDDNPTTRMLENLYSNDLTYLEIREIDGVRYVFYEPKNEMFSLNDLPNEIFDLVGLNQHLVFCGFCTSCSIAVLDSQFNGFDA